VSDNTLTLIQRPKKLKRLKMKPRGRPFPPGNKIGHRFEPGNNANPGGRPRFAKISEALRALLAAKPTDKFEITTNAEAIAYKIFRMGKKGSIAAIREVGDRSEGRPNISIGFGNSGGDNLPLLIAAMTVRHREIGPPENWIPLEEGADDEQQEG
jgi:hypothetical protein